MNNNDSIKRATAVIGPDSIVTDIEVRAHHFRSDETEAYGGQDQFPDPFDYIVSGLASCVAISLRQFADRHDMALERAEVECTYEKIKDATTPKKDKITKTIRLFGNLNDADRERLLKVAKCPAHLMLDRGIVIDTVAE